jgi:hypothetical protein
MKVALNGVFLTVQPLKECLQVKPVLLLTQMLRRSLLAWISTTSLQTNALSAVGFHDEPQCASVCPVDCCVDDENHRESKEELTAKKESLHA